MTDNFQLFNLKTMSGVFPGTRTQVYQRVRVHALDAPEESWQWARIQWYDEPPACVVEMEARGAALSPGDAGGPHPPQAVLRISAPQAGEQTGEVRVQLERGLRAAGWELRCCGTCAAWRQLGAATPDDLPVGRCSWRPAAGMIDLPPALGAQSVLALACQRWAPVGADEAPIPTEEAITITPMRKRAEEETDERWSYWGRLRQAFGGNRKRQEAAGGHLRTWEEGVVERSGVGAGTEPCYACQGRIANLGALAVATPEGDKQTFSVWRCRSCFTYYLNDWIDRWERTDSLETEESYYRLCPAEALEVLAVIDSVVHAEHPAGRHERDAERQWMLEFLGGRPQLSHQVKQGR